MRKAATWRLPIYEIPSIAVLKREVFGPILHVVRYAGDRLGDVCDEIDATGYGLTLSIHSRIKATAEFVAGRVRVGNVYVNRNQIGAVVGVQPFGGEGLSGTGPKAGGPNYLQAPSRWSGFSRSTSQRPGAMRVCSLPGPTSLEAEAGAIAARSIRVHL